MKRVAIVFTGGTISMQFDPAAGGNRPTLNGAQILERAPGVARLATLEAIDWGLVPASHLSFAQLIDIARVVGDQLARTDIDGVVIVQGTDTIEETAFAFDLLLPVGKPVAVTGAMRDSSSPEFDGPRNLGAAVICATSEDLRGAGVVVAMGGRVICAEQTVKVHSTAMDAFRPRDGEQLGEVRDGILRLLASPPNRGRHLDQTTVEPVEDVYLVTAAVGMDGAAIRGLAAQRPSGLVVAATGSGNTHPDMLAAAQERMDGGTIVCLSTRAPGGSVDPIYAFPGGGATWAKAGAIMSRLDGPKTRVALALGLGAGLEKAAIASLVGPDISQ